MKRILPGVGYDVYETADGVSLVIDGALFKVEQTHPFKVQAVKFPSTGNTVSFSVYVGHIFGIGKNKDSSYSPPREGLAWSIEEDNIRVGIGATLTPISGSSTIDAAFLDERNVGMRYSGTLSTLHDNVLYVEVKTDSDSNVGFEAKLHLKDVVDAYSDYEFNIPDTDFIEGKDTLKTSDVWHSSPASPTNPFVLDDLIFSGPGGSQIAGSIQLNQQWNLYQNTHKRKGTYQIPIAYIRQIDNKWTVRQVLRSDIFFPYGLNTTTYYIGSHVDDFGGGCGA